MQTESPPTSAAWRGRRPSSFVFPLLLVVVGAVLLLNNLGLLPWSVWTALGQLWPVILIILGIDLLFGRRNPWLGAAITSIALVIVLGAAIWLTYSGASLTAQTAGTTQAAQTDQQSIAVPLAGATSGNVTLQFGAGVLKVGALPEEATDLARANANLPSGMHLSQRTNATGGVADVTVSTNGNGGFVWPFRGFGRNSSDSTLDAQLARKFPLTVRADVGAGQSDFDLTDLSVRDFTLNSGAGQATVRFPTSAGQTTADIHSGVGQIILEVPPGVGAYIHGSNGIGNIRVPTDRFQKVADGYQTSGFSTATNRVDVTLHLGVGEVDVR